VISQCRDDAQLGGLRQPNASQGLTFWDPRDGCPPEGGRYMNPDRSATFRFSIAEGP
jgi:hypothetical protein